MINSVNNSYNKNVFRDFSKNHDENFFVQNPSPSVQTPPQEKKSHKGRNIFVGIGGSALLAGASLLVLMRGLPKNTTKYLENIKEFLEKKLKKSSLADSDKWTEFYTYSIRKVNGFIDKSQSINNVTSLKDILFKKFMDLTKFTGNIHKKISVFFEKISRNTVKNVYNSTAGKFKKMFNSFEKLDTVILKNTPDEIITINGKTLTKREWVEIARKHRINLEQSVMEFVSEPKQTARYKQIKATTSKLCDQFWDASFKDFWSKNNRFRRKEMWQTFIPAEQISAGKSTLAEQVAVIRNKITYTNADKMNLIEEHLKKMEELILPSDVQGIALVKKLKWFLKNPDGMVENADVFKRELVKLTDRPLQEGLDKSILAHQQTLRNTYMKSITDLLDSKNCGELQEMLSIYEKIAPYELSVLKPQVTKAVKSFDKSLKTETVDFFDKVRDLELGSAPTDLISPITSAGLITYGLVKADDADERKSVVLKVGIPIIGGLLVSILCTTRLIAGGKAMLLGAGSGFALNQVGSFVDKMRKNNSKNPTNSQVA